MEGEAETDADGEILGDADSETDGDALTDTLGLADALAKSECNLKTKSAVATGLRLGG